MTPASDRRVAVDGVTNMRDLGGLRTTDGRVVVAGQVFRAEAMAAPGAGEVYAVHDAAMPGRLAGLGLRTVLDLRTDVECDNVPCLWAPDTGATLVRVPILEGAPGSDTDIMAMLLDGRMRRLTAERLGQFYVEVLTRRPTDLGRALSVIADSDRRPVLIHCTGGKDRTGIVVALLLDVLGVPPDAIIDDYAETGRNRPDRVLHYVDLLADAGLTPDDARVLFETPPDTMRLMLEDLHRRYGTAQEYFEGVAGVDPAVIERLRVELLTSV